MGPLNPSKGSFGFWICLVQGITCLSGSREVCVIFILVSRYDQAVSLLSTQKNKETINPPLGDIGGS